MSNILPEVKALTRLWARVVGIARRTAPALTGNAARMGASFLLSKYVALIQGPAGVALLGQFINLTGMLQNFSTGAIDNGVVRYVAEARRDGAERMTAVLSASLQIIAVLGGTTALVVVVIAEFVAHRIFHSADYVGLVRLMAFAGLVQAGLAWSSAVLNGVGRLGRLGLLNVISACGVAFAVCVAVLVGFRENTSLLLCLAFANVPALAYALWQLYQARQELASLRLERWPWCAYTQFARYSAMSWAAAVIVPTSAILVRNILVRHGGLDAAGVYEGVNRLSTAYITLITTTLAMYYLPRISAATHKEQGREMRSMLQLVAPGMLVIGTLVWLARDPLLALLYSDKFTVSGRLMMAQVVGDALRMTSWVLAYQMIARGMAGTFVVAELSAAAVRVGLSVWLVPSGGPEGAVFAYAVTSSLYLGGMIFLFRDQFLSSAPTSSL